MRNRNRQATYPIIAAILIGAVMIVSFQNCGGQFTSTSKSVSSLSGHSELFVEMIIAGVPPKEAELVAEKVKQLRVVVSSDSGQEATFIWERKSAKDTAPTLAALQVLGGNDRKVQAIVVYERDGQTVTLAGETTVDISSDQVYATVQLALVE